MEPQKDSIFKSSIRTFFKTFAAFLGIFLALVPFLLLSSSSGKSLYLQPRTSIAILPNLQGERHFSSSAPAILQIPIHGVVGSHELNSETIEMQLTDSKNTLLLHNPIRGILLHVNSPGGGVTDCDTIYRLIKRYKKQYQVPVYAYVNGLCASAAMYISCSADKIYSSPTSIVGSVGVLMGPFFNVKEALQRWGIQSKTLTRGKDKDMMSPFREWKPGESASLERIMAFFYDRFVTIVSSARPKLTPSLLKNELGANVFDSEQAEKLGYVDAGNASYQQALSALLQEANIDPRSSYQVLELMPKHSWLKDFIRASPLFTGKITHQIMGDKTSEIADPFLYLYDPSSFVSYE